ncbi:hypothetical protein AAG570_002738 [Ranatra chinensis]|uniref:WW domain-containing protein n=1 Tax=Ranatra chinensis TaxID=642074 RepID=A0ABD0Y8U1_9HEMI
MSGNPDVEQIKSNLVVRIDQDSDSELQALFDSVLKPDSKRPLQVPLRMRKLPNSFFNPPSTGSKSPSVSSISHSRENSADSAVFGTPVGAGQGAGGGLQQTYASASQQQQHAKQRSYDIAAAAAVAALDELGPLPPGWEQARTSEGQIYYLKYVTVYDTFAFYTFCLLTGPTVRFVLLLAVTVLQAVCLSPGCTKATRDIYGKPPGVSQSRPHPPPPLEKNHAFPISFSQHSTLAPNAREYQGFKY